MINGITYFRKNSPYSGDVTKNCALDGIEVDNNFFVLEGRDIKSLRIEDSDIVIELLNGDIMRSADALKGITDLQQTSISDIVFDKENGILKFTRNGEQIAITGFATEMNTGVTVSVDDSLKGNGLAANPVSISPMFKTGQYRPVKRLISVADGEKMPNCSVSVVGDRYLTKENVSTYGMLYNYKAVKKIACNLRDANSPWRIPTKEDWDDMLNAVEPCPSDREHSSASANRYLGEYAGKLLKSKDLWLHSDVTDGCGGNGTCIIYDTNCDAVANSCGDNNCENSDNDNCCCSCDCDGIPTDGLDAFGFRVVPSGYADDGQNFVFFGERAYFWTATNSNCESVYVKRFENNKNSVYQNVIAGQNYLSLRLVKNYNGNNFHESENILSDQYPTVLMPSVKNGHSIWTSVNISLDCGNCGRRIEPNNGLELTSTTKFYLNEWDGKNWLRNELKDGESVVIMNSPNGQTNDEYRLSNGKLINVGEFVKETVNGNINPKLDELNAKLENEINRSIAKDTLIEDTINNELKPKLTQNSETIETVNNNLVASINTINDSIKTVNDNLVDAVNTINGGIATEIQERKDADEEIKATVTTNKEVLDQEIERAKSKEEELDKAITKEKQDRETKDTELEDKIEQYINTGNDGYAQLKERVDANEASIDNLDNRIDTTDSNLNHTNQVLTDFGKETEKAFEQINKVISDGFNTINGGIATEIQERKDADNTEKDERIASDNKIKDAILTDEGTSFDTDKGILTLKSKGGINDIKVQFSMNFGEF